MFTPLRTVQHYAGDYIEGFALTTDSLPTTGIVNGSKVEVLDASTGVLVEKRFNQAAASWVTITEPEPESTSESDASASAGDG